MRCYAKIFVVVVAYSVRQFIYFVLFMHAHYLFKGLSLLLLLLLLPLLLRMSRCRSPLDDRQKEDTVTRSSQRFPIVDERTDGKKE